MSAVMSAPLVAAAGHWRLELLDWQGVTTSAGITCWLAGGDAVAVSVIQHSTVVCYWSWPVIARHNLWANRGCCSLCKKTVSCWRWNNIHIDTTPPHTLCNVLGMC